MFGMGFIEILLVAVVAIIALGPEKLPSAMVDIAKFFKKFKSGIEDAKSTLDNELKLTDMKEEANKFKAQVEGAKSSMSVDLNDLTHIEKDTTKTKTTITPQNSEVKREKVSFAKESTQSEDQK